MKIKIMKGIALMLSLALFVTACKESDIEFNNDENSKSEFSMNYLDESIKTDYIIKNGVVHFKDPQTFKSLTTNKKFKTEFEKANNNFESYAKETKKVFELYAKAKTVSEKETIVAQYPDFITKKNKMVIPSLMNPYTAFLNKDGIMYIGKMIYHYSKDTQEIIFDGDMKKVSLLKDKSFKDNAVLRYNTSPRNVKSAKTNSCTSLSEFTVDYNFPNSYKACLAYGYFSFLTLPNNNVEVTANIYSVGDSNTDGWYPDAYCELLLNFNAKVFVNNIERGSFQYSYAEFFTYGIFISVNDIIGTYEIPANQVNVPAEIRLSGSILYNSSPESNLGAYASCQ